MVQESDLYKAKYLCISKKETKKFMQGNTCKYTS